MEDKKEFVKNIKLNPPTINGVYVDVVNNWDCQKPNVMLAFTFAASGNRSEAISISPNYASKRVGIAAKTTDEEKSVAAEIAMNLKPDGMSIYRKYKNTKPCEVVYFLFPN